jgi:hypothetical protein
MLATGNSPSGGPAKRPHFQLTETSSPSDIIDWLKDTLTGAEFQSLCVENVSAKTLLACRDTQVTTGASSCQCSSLCILSNDQPPQAHHVVALPASSILPMLTQTGHKSKLSSQSRSY